MSIVPAHGSATRARPGKSGRPSSSDHHLDHRARLAPAVGRGHAGERGRAQRVGVGEHRPRARPRRPPSSTTPAARPSSRSTRSTGASVRIRRPGRLGRRAQRARHRAHATAGVAPRARLARPPRRGRGRSRRTPSPGPPAAASVPIRPWMANGTRTGSRRDAGEVVGDRAVEDLRADRLQPALAVGRLEHERPRAGGRAPPSAAPTRRSRRRRPGDQSRASCARVRSRRDHVTTSPPVGERARTGRARGRRRAGREPARSSSSMISPAQQRQRVGARRRADAGPQLLGHAGAADEVAALEAPRRRARRAPGRRRRRGRCGPRR